MRIFRRFILGPEWACCRCCRNVVFAPGGLFHYFPSFGIRLGFSLPFFRTSRAACSCLMPGRLIFLILPAVAAAGRTGVTRRPASGATCSHACAPWRPLYRHEASDYKAGNLLKAISARVFQRRCLSPRGNTSSDADLGKMHASTYRKGYNGLPSKPGLKACLRGVLTHGGNKDQYTPGRDPERGV